MQTDTYTKVVLTIIAASLVLLVGQNSISVSNAQPGKPMPVVICDAAGRGDNGYGCAAVDYGKLIVKQR